MGQKRDFSEETAITIDSEIKRIVNDNYDRAKKLLNENIDALHRLASALLEKEVLDSEEIDNIIFGGNKPPGGAVPVPEKGPAEKIRSETSTEGVGGPQDAARSSLK